MAGRPLEVLSSEEVYSGRLFKVEVEHVKLPSGRESVREIVKHPGAVVMVVVDDQERILLVTQYRRAADRYLLELPAGTRDHQRETAEECAARETQEETGYSAAHIERLGGFFSAPGFSSEYLECFLCTDLGSTKLHAEEDEDLTLTRLTLDDLKATIQRGEIEDAKTLAGIYLYIAMKGK